MHRVWSLCAVLLFPLIAVTSPAASAGVVPAPILGQWTENGTDGTLKWDVAGDRIAITPVDAKGQSLDQPMRVDVVYQAVGQGWDIVVQAPNGAPIGTGRAELDKGDLVIGLPGVGVHRLRRTR